MTAFLLALQFLTIIPVKIKDVSEKKIAQSMIFFPLVGLLLGLALCGLNKLLFALDFPQFSINIILIVLLVFLTGGMHLDGLSDTLDAFLSGKSKEEMLIIMRDSHAGVMGVLGIISSILLKIALLYAVSIFAKPIALILMCVFSRWGMVLSMHFFPYARKEGKAKSFITGANLKIFILATIITLIIAILTWRLQGLVIFGIIAIISYAFGKLICRKIGGMTGDTLGAMGELTEIATLFSVSVLTGGQLWMA